MRTCGQSFRICAFHLLSSPGGAAAFSREFRVSFRGGNVEALGVFFHHAMGVENRCDAADRFAHQLQPGKGKFAVGFCVVERNDLVFEQLIETAGIDLALEFNRAILDLRPDGPSLVAVVAFAPPAIEDA